MLNHMTHTSRHTARLERIAREMPYQKPPEKMLGGLRYRTAYGWSWDHMALVMLTVSALITGMLLVIVLAGLLPMFSFVLSLPTILVLLILLRLLLYEPR